VITYLLEKGARVKAHDYKGMENMKALFKDKVEWCNDPVSAAAAPTRSPW
jgi:UDP-glucose 6-dehydrogenase